MHKPIKMNLPGEGLIMHYHHQLDELELSVAKYNPAVLVAYALSSPPYGMSVDEFVRLTGGVVAGDKLRPLLIHVHNSTGLVNFQASMEDGHWYKRLCNEVAQVLSRQEGRIVLSYKGRKLNRLKIAELRQLGRDVVAISQHTSKGLYRVEPRQELKAEPAKESPSELHARHQRDLDAFLRAFTGSLSKTLVSRMKAGGGRDALCRPSFLQQSVSEALREPHMYKETSLEPGLESPHYHLMLHCGVPDLGAEETAMAQLLESRLRTYLRRQKGKGRGISVNPRRIRLKPGDTQTYALLCGRESTGLDAEQRRMQYVLLHMGLPGRLRSHMASQKALLESPLQQQRVTRSYLRALRPADFGSSSSSEEASDEDSSSSSSSSDSDSDSEGHIGARRGGSRRRRRTGEPFVVRRKGKNLPGGDGRFNYYGNLISVRGELGEEEEPWDPGYDSEVSIAESIAEAQLSSSYEASPADLDPLRQRTAFALDTKIREGLEESLQEGDEQEIGVSMVGFLRRGKKAREAKKETRGVTREAVKEKVRGVVRKAAKEVARRVARNQFENWAARTLRGGTVQLNSLQEFIDGSNIKAFFKLLEGVSWTDFSARAAAAAAATEQKDFQVVTQRVNKLLDVAEEFGLTVTWNELPPNMRDVLTLLSRVKASERNLRASIQLLVPLDDAHVSMETDKGSATGGESAALNLALNYIHFKGPGKVLRGFTEGVICEKKLAETLMDKAVIHAQAGVLNIFVVRAPVRKCAPRIRSELSDDDDDATSSEPVGRKYGKKGKKKKKKHGRRVGESLSASCDLCGKIGCHCRKKKKQRGRLGESLEEEEQRVAGQLSSNQYGDWVAQTKRGGTVQLNSLQEFIQENGNHAFFKLFERVSWRSFQEAMKEWGGREFFGRIATAIDKILPTGSTSTNMRDVLEALSRANLQRELQKGGPVPITLLLVPPADAMVHMEILMARSQDSALNLALSYIYIDGELETFDANCERILAEALVDEAVVRAQAGLLTIFAISAPVRSCAPRVRAVPVYVAGQLSLSSTYADWVEQTKLGRTVQLSSLQKFIDESGTHNFFELFKEVTWAEFQQVMEEANLPGMPDLIAGINKLLHEEEKQEEHIDIWHVLMTLSRAGQKDAANHRVLHPRLLVPPADALVHLEAGLDDPYVHLNLAVNYFYLDGDDRLARLSEYTCEGTLGAALLEGAAIHAKVGLLRIDAIRAPIRGCAPWIQVNPPRIGCACKAYKRKGALQLLGDHLGDYMHSMAATASNSLGSYTGDYRWLSLLEKLPKRDAFNALLKASGYLYVLANRPERVNLVYVPTDASLEKVYELLIHNPITSNSYSCRGLHSLKEVICYLERGGLSPGNPICQHALALLEVHFRAVMSTEEAATVGSSNQKKSLVILGKGGQAALASKSIQHGPNRLVLIDAVIVPSTLHAVLGDVSTLSSAAATGPGLAGSLYSSSPPQLGQIRGSLQILNTESLPYHGTCSGCDRYVAPYVGDAVSRKLTRAKSEETWWMDEDAVHVGACACRSHSKKKKHGKGLHEKVASLIGAHYPAGDSRGSSSRFMQIYDHYGSHGGNDDALILFAVSNSAFGRDMQTAATQGARAQGKGFLRNLMDNYTCRGSSFQLGKPNQYVSERKRVFSYDGKMLKGKNGASFTVHTVFRHPQYPQVMIVVHDALHANLSKA